MKRIYVVKAGSNRFNIPDGNTAWSFAEIAKTYMEQSKYETFNTVTVELVDIEEEPDPVDDDEEEEDDEGNEV